MKLELIDLVVNLLRRWRVGVAYAILTSVTVLAFAFVQARTFTVEAQLLPRSSASGLAGLGGLAAQFGVDVPAGDAGESPQFIVALLESRQIARSAIASLVGSDGPGVSADSLLSLLDVSSDDGAHALELAELRFGQLLKTRVDAGTRTVLVELAVEDRAVGLLLVQGAVDAAVEKAISLKREEAEDHVRELAPLVDSAASRLSVAEDQLSRFMLANRAATGNPVTQLQLDVLRRRVSETEQVYQTLSRALAEAQIAKSRSAAPVSVVQRPWASVKPDSRKLAFWAAVGVVVGLSVFVFHCAVEMTGVLAALRRALSSANL